jgi:L-iditol 2-dehydrogenase
MRGNFFLGNGQFGVREIPVPEIGNGEVLIKVAACGICGTDVHICHGDKGSAEVNPPVILGHELSGIVEKIGSEVTTVKTGDHVTVDPNIYCGKCHYCQIGKKQMCENLSAVGVTRNGGFAEYCVVPEQQCILLNNQIPLEYGAMTEPLACCIHGVDRADIKLGDTVLVIGGGAIGLLMIQLARLAGASKVVLSEPVAMRRAIGLELGADAVIDPVHENIEESLKKVFGIPGADVVIECVGLPAAVEQAFSAANRGATILLFSVPAAGATYEMHLEEVFQKELKIVGSMINPDTHKRAAELINNKKVHIEKIITHCYPLEQVEDAILMQTQKESIKVIVKP